MRSIRYLIFLLFFLPNMALPALVFSQEFLSGQVLMVDTKKMQFVIDHEKNRKKQKILVLLTKENALPRLGGKHVFPECVKEGNWLRIWGLWEKNKQDDIFLAHEIKGCADGGCSDPTGIMSRLRKLLSIPETTTGNYGHGTSYGHGDSKNTNNNGSGSGSGSGRGHGNGGNGSGNGSGGGGGGQGGGGKGGK